MSLAGVQKTIEEQIKEAIEKSVADSTAEVGGDGRHFEIQVISPVFEGNVPSRNSGLSMQLSMT